MDQAMEEHEFTIPVQKGVKVGLRINNKDEVVVVHPDTPAANAGLCAGDVVVAVDGTVPCGEVNAVKLWSKGAGLPERKLRVKRLVTTSHEDKAPSVSSEATAAEKPTASAVQPQKSQEPWPTRSPPRRRTPTA